MPAKRPSSWRIVIAVSSLALLVLTALEAFQIAWGSGTWLGHLSLKWSTALLAVYGLLALLAAAAWVILFSARWKAWRAGLMAWRQSLGRWRWVLLAAALVLPAWFVFFSPWGGLFTGMATRTLLFIISLAIASALLSRSDAQLVEWKDLLAGGLLLGGSLVLAESLIYVSNYPFALHWSEGNRLWDYSLAFGTDRYNYDGSLPIFAWIDPGRQTLWGLPFLIPNVPIWAVRLWGALLVTVPYAILGWVAFRPLAEHRQQWWLAGLWAMVFLNQGPIYTPLVLAAILVAFARRKPIWLALPLVYIAGHYAGVSRLTWRFAPAIYAVILTLGDAVMARGKLAWQDWLRAAALALAGIWSKGLEIVVGVVTGLLAELTPSAIEAPAAAPTGQPAPVESLQGLQAVSSHQPFLWERLFPNPVYPPGILLGLALATLPLIALIIYLARRGFWKTRLWQQIATVLGMGALLVVGVIASAKVGGGIDLHNMDMFLVGLVLLAGMVWEGGLAARLLDLLKRSGLVRWLLAGMVFIPAFVPLISGRPLDLPAQERTDFVLQRVQDEVACARQYGPVLFMDQRQLITFGHMGDLPLVVDYEKKYVMDQALGVNEPYLAQLRQDLADGRFAMVVTERSAILYKEPDVESIGDSLNEENNAWVEWVTTPLLQYYESVADFKDAAIEIFVPIQRDFDCP